MFSLNDNKTFTNVTMKKKTPAIVHFSRQQNHDSETLTVSRDKCCWLTTCTTCSRHYIQINRQTLFLFSATEKKPHTGLINHFRCGLNKKTFYSAYVRGKNLNFIRNMGNRLERLQGGDDLNASNTSLKGSMARRHTRRLHGREILLLSHHHHSEQQIRTTTSHNGPQTTASLPSIRNNQPSSMPSSEKTQSHYHPTISRHHFLPLNHPFRRRCSSSRTITTRASSSSSTTRVTFSSTTLKSSPSTVSGANRRVSSGGAKPRFYQTLHGCRAVGPLVEKHVQEGQCSRARFRLMWNDVLVAFGVLLGWI